MHDWPQDFTPKSTSTKHRSKTVPPFIGVGLCWLNELGDMSEQTPDVIEPVEGLIPFAPAAAIS